MEVGFSKRRVLSSQEKAPILPRRDCQLQIGISNIHEKWIDNGRRKESARLVLCAGTKFESKKGYASTSLHAPFLDF